jgi:hypothetical protein
LLPDPSLACGGQLSFPVTAKAKSYPKTQNKQNNGNQGKHYSRASHDENPLFA